MISFFRTGITVSVVSLLPFVSAAEVQTASAVPAASAVTKSLFDSKGAQAKYWVPSSNQVMTAAGPAASTPRLAVTIQPGMDGYPGVRLPAPGGKWNLAAFGHVEARVINTGTKTLSLSLRVDNAGDWKDNPWNTETVSLQPGESGTVTVLFGYSYGRKPGFALNPSAVTQLMLFTTKSDAVQSFQIESIVAGGTAGEKPAVASANIRENPKNGVLLGRGTTIDATKQITARNAQTLLVPDTQTLRVVFPVSGAEAAASLKPAQGRWDLRDYLQVQVRLRNDGKTPIMPRVRLESNGGPSDWVKAAQPLAPGATAEISVPFAGATTFNLARKETGSRITSDAIAAVTIGAEKSTGETALHIESIQAIVPPAPKLPDWLGKRPPVSGDWIKTLDDEFNGTSLDPTIWSIYGENYWDKQSHWSKENVLIGGGSVKLRYTKKTGPNNDDPRQKTSNYASGYLHTYDRWAQRYGYFEARMRLPRAPGLWPAFWMMPDRGSRSDPQWKRQDTANGGMEFDIMEHLTRWGPNRYNIAMHYDGYGKEHKSPGTDKIYLQPDKDGFITCGLLWTPGSAIYYYNGQEVLRWEDTRISGVPGILMFTLPMGGWDNSPLEDANLPDDFEIDYVRVWQRKDLASPEDGKKPILKLTER
ncbi:MAG: glycoside hydrolase family 16 protein [Armatimonadota bacterium]